MRFRSATSALLALAIGIASTGCATRKYVRARLNERVTPLEQRTGELEETSRRNTQEISRLGRDIQDVRGRADRAQTQADLALVRANEVNERVTTTEQNVRELKTNLDRYSLKAVTTVHFDFDRYDLTPDAMMKLDQIAGEIRDRSSFILEIQGFADSRGTDRYNTALTERRAETVRRYLAEHHDIALFRMHVIGLGTVRAVADNTTSEGRAQNRRVEIRLLTREVTEGVAGGPTSQP